MTEHEQPPSCTTCGQPLPCVLHDRKIHEAILAAEEPLPGLEKTREWNVTDATMRTFIPFPDGRILARTDDRIILFDLSEPNDNGKVVGTNISHIESLGNSRILMKGIGPRPFSIVDFGMTPFVTRYLDIREQEGGARHNPLAVLSESVVLAVLNEPYRLASVFDECDLVVIDCLKPDQPIRTKIHLRNSPSYAERLTDTTAILVFGGGRRGNESYQFTFFEDGHSTLVSLGRGMAPSTPYRSLFAVSDRCLLSSDNIGNVSLIRKEGSLYGNMPIGSVGIPLADVTREVDGTVFLATQTGAIKKIDIREPSPSIVSVAETGIQRPEKLAALSESRLLISNQEGIQLWEIPEAKLRAYHERQTKTEEEEIPELPNV